MHRRVFLKSGGLALATLGWSPWVFGRTALAAEPVEPGAPGPGKTLVCLFLRGGADALSMVVPHGDPEYYALRPTTAIAHPRAGDDTAAIDLDGFFGLHPKLAPLKPLWDRGLLAPVHAVGSPSKTRSHIKAQNYFETGTPDMNGTSDGWLNRVLRATHVTGARSGAKRTSAPMRAVSLTPQVPRILAGHEPALALGGITGFATDGSGEGPRWDPAGGAVRDAGTQTSDSTRVLGALASTQYQLAPSAAYPNSEFGGGLRRIAQLIKARVGIEVAFADMAGWDTHLYQGGAAGYLAERLEDFAQSVAALVADLGDRMENVVILAMSEFGRAARENRSGGTDHGHAGALFVIGGGVNGGKVYGRWPGLGAEQLYEGRDLASTTDVRAVCSEVVVRHLGVKRVGDIFPGYAAREADWLGVLEPRTKRRKDRG